MSTPETHARHASSSLSPDNGHLDSTYSWLRLTACILISTLGSVGMWSIIVVMPGIQTEFGVDRADASLPFTVIMIAFGIGNLVTGRIVDRFGIVLPMAVSVILLSSGFYLSTLTTSIGQFAILHGVLVGVGAATFFGPLLSDISHWFEKRRGIAVAAAASGNYFAGAIWPLFLKDIVTTNGWRDAYALVALILLVSLPPLILCLRKRVPPHALNMTTVSTNRNGTPHQINLSPKALQTLLVVAGVACCVAMSMPQVHIVAYCADLGFGVARGAEMLSIMLVGGIVSRLLSGILADYFGGVRTVILGSILQCIALFLYIPFNGLASLYVVSLVFGLSQGGIVPGYAIVIREYLPARDAGWRVGMVIFATVIGMSFGGWVSGLIYDLTRSYQAAFLNGIAWNMANILIMSFVLWRTRKPALATA
ncbi:MFS transporter [Sneathiella chinensis]|uniref:MFS transporter n=1 Tax=Sneathiella chinensis TaxID=349750 RepID=A0ABQ5U6T4_9PROT|nr:MFS transporter [Sneathiella chinensis]GLQ06933.1 MFS transporter [Sneathiella chinensis]